MRSSTPISSSSPNRPGGSTGGTLPVSSYEHVLSEVRSLRRRTSKVQRLATTSLDMTDRDNDGDTEHRWRPQQEDLDNDDSLGLMEVLDCSRKSPGGLSDGRMSSSSDTAQRTGQLLYHGTWPQDHMWASEPTHDRIQRNSMDRTEVTSVMSFASSSGAAPLERILPPKNLEVKVDMVYSLLSMLGTSENPDMGETLLALSTNPESSLAMRQAGCLPILVQLIYSDKESETREKAAKALYNLVQIQGDDKLRKREVKVLKLLEQIRIWCNLEKDEVVSHPTAVTENIIKLSFDEGYRQTICELGGVYALANLIEADHRVHKSDNNDSECVQMRRYAGMCLTNLTFGHSENKSLLCSFRNFMKCLVAQLKCENEDLRQVTASVLRNLSWRADQNSRTILRECGSVKALIAAAIISKKESTLKSILSALWNLSAHCSVNKAEICNVDGALGFLVDTLNYQPSSTNLMIQENAGGILRNISSHIAIREDYRSILRKHNCIPILLQQLKSPSLTIVSNACGTLWNLSAKCPEDQKTLWDLGAAQMLRSLNHSKHLMIATSSRAALKNLLSSRPNLNLTPTLDQTAKELGLPALPTLNARKQKALVKDLQINLSEMLEIEPTSPLNEKNFIYKNGLEKKVLERDFTRNFEGANFDNDNFGNEYKKNYRDNPRRNFGDLDRDSFDEMPKNFGELDDFEEKPKNFGETEEDFGDNFKNYRDSSENFDNDSSQGFSDGSQNFGVKPKNLRGNPKNLSHPENYRERPRNLGEPKNFGGSENFGANPRNLGANSKNFENPENYREKPRNFGGSENFGDTKDLVDNFNRMTLKEDRLGFSSLPARKYEGPSSKQLQSFDDDQDFDDMPIDYSQKYSEKSKNIPKGKTFEKVIDFSPKELEEPIDFSKKYPETKNYKPEFEPIDYSKPKPKSSEFSPKNYPKSKGSPTNFTDYAITDLDQPTNYSLRYRENDSDSDDCLDKERSPRNFYEETDDQIKTYCTEGTPYETPYNFSTATSLSDLRIDQNEGEKEKVETNGIEIQKTPPKDKKQSCYSSGLMSPEKPVNYCEEGTPGYFSRVSSLSSLNATGLDSTQIEGEKDKDCQDEPRSPSNKEAKVENQENCDGATKVDNKERESGKVVKFGSVVDYAEETPLMFSRSSSLGSLSSTEQHSIHDDRSSVSDFSRLTSGIISPSELPDSPTQTVPPSPRARKAPIDFPTVQNRASTNQKSVFDDNVTKFKETNTPVEFSTGTSLSSLTFDDEPSIPTKIALLQNGTIKRLEIVEEGCPSGTIDKNAQEVANKSNENVNLDATVSDGEEDGDEDILAACINIGMQNNRLNQEKPSKLPSQLPKYKSPSPSRSIPIKNMSSRLPILESRPLKLEGAQDTVKTYCTENTPAMLSHAGSNSDLSVLSITSNNKTCDNIGKEAENMDDEKLNFSDDSSNMSGDNDNILAECIQSGMPKAKDTQPKIIKNGPRLPLPVYEARDEFSSFAVEDSPCQFSLRSSLSDLTVDGNEIKLIKNNKIVGSVGPNSNRELIGQEISPNRDRLNIPGSSSNRFEANSQIGNQLVQNEVVTAQFSLQSSLSDLSVDHVKPPKASKSSLNHESVNYQPKCNREPLVEDSNLEKVESLSSLSIESHDSTENLEQALLEQCISSAMPKSRQNFDLTDSSNSKNAFVTSVAKNTITTTDVPNQKNLKQEKSEKEMNNGSNLNSGESPNSNTNLNRFSNQVNFPKQKLSDSGESPNSIDNSNTNLNMFPNPKYDCNQIDKCSDVLVDTSLENNESPDLSDSENQSQSKIKNRMLDPDAMIESLDRFTAELVSHSSHLNSHEIQNVTSNNDQGTWDEDISPNDVSFPSFSISAPLIASFKSDSDSKISNEIKSNGIMEKEKNQMSNVCPSNSNLTQKESNQNGTQRVSSDQLGAQIGPNKIGMDQLGVQIEPKSLSPDLSENRDHYSSMSESTIIAMEATRVFNDLSQNMMTSMTSCHSLELDNVNPPSMFESLTSLTSNSAKNSPLLKKKLSSRELSKMISSITSANSNSLELDNVNPPSMMESVTSLTFSDKNSSTKNSPILRKKLSQREIQANLVRRALANAKSLDNLDSFTNLDLVKPPSAMGDYLDMIDMESSITSIASINSEIAEKIHFGDQNGGFGEQNDRLCNFNNRSDLNTGFGDQNTHFEGQNESFEGQNGYFREQTSRFEVQKSGFEGQNSHFEGQNLHFGDHTSFEGHFGVQNSSLESRNTHFEQQNLRFGGKNGYFCSKDDYSGTKNDDFNHQNDFNLDTTKSNDHTEQFDTKSGHSKSQFTLKNDPFGSKAEYIGGIDDMNPPSLMNDVTDMNNSTADIITENIYSETEVFEDCFTHTIDQTLQNEYCTSDEITEFSDANSITPIQSDFNSSSAESTPKKSRSINKRLTPKQKRQLAKERYKTYTVAAEILTRSTESPINELGINGESPELDQVDGGCHSSGSNSPKLTPKERRMLDRERFQTRVLEPDIGNKFGTFTKKGDTNCVITPEVGNIVPNDQNMHFQSQNSGLEAQNMHLQTKGSKIVSKFSTFTRKEQNLNSPNSNRSACTTQNSGSEGYVTANCSLQMSLAKDEKYGTYTKKGSQSQSPPASPKSSRGESPSKLRTKTDIRKAMQQKRIENSERFRTRTLSSESNPSGANSSPEPQNREPLTLEELHNMLENETKLILTNLENSNGVDDLLDCETLSLVSNDDDSETNSLSSVNYRTYHKSWSVNKNLPVIDSHNLGKLGETGSKLSRIGTPGSNLGKIGECTSSGGTPGSNLGKIGESTQGGRTVGSNLNRFGLGTTQKSHEGTPISNIGKFGIGSNQKSLEYPTKIGTPTSSNINIKTASNLPKPNQKIPEPKTGLPVSKLNLSISKTVTVTTIPTPTTKTPEIKENGPESLPNLIDQISLEGEPNDSEPKSLDSEEKKPKIVKPGLENPKPQVEESPKAIRGKKKVYVSPYRSQNLSKPQNKPKINSNLVKNVTSTLTRAPKLNPKVEKKAQSAPKVNRTSLPIVKGPQNEQQKRQSLPAKVERQGTFVLEESSTNLSNENVSKVGTTSGKPLEDKPKSKIARAINACKSKSATNLKSPKLQSKIVTSTTKSRSTLSSRSPSSDRDFTSKAKSVSNIQPSTSSQSLKYSKNLSSNSLNQRSNSNVSISSNESVKKKQVTSKIASLWKKVEDSKKKQGVGVEKVDKRVWITPNKPSETTANCDSTTF